MNREPGKTSTRKAKREELRFLRAIPAEWLPGKIPRDFLPRPHPKPA